MTKPITFANTFSLVLPNEDWTIYEDELYTIFNQKVGVGTLQISIYRTDDAVPLSALADIVRDYQVDNGLKQYQNIKTYGDTAVSHFYFFTPSEEDKKKDDYWRIWHILRQNTLLFITYNCDDKLKDKEKAFIDTMIKSIRFI